MEILSRKLRTLKEYPQFSYHPKCSRMGLSHLIFADDLMVFVRGDLPSVKAVSNSLKQFAAWSGLIANTDKTNIYFGGVGANTKKLILEQTGFVEDYFPFRYLGIPLSSARLTGEMHHMLIQKIKNKLLHWTSQKLSYAGKLQLLNSVIFGLENFWCSCLLLPKVVVKRIEKLCKQFLWGYNDGSRKHVWMSWSSVCKPKLEGGFDIREILSWNKALLMKWVWKLIVQNDSAWATWVHYYFLKTESWATVQAKSTSSWLWKCVLRVRDEFITKIGGTELASSVLCNWSRRGSLNIHPVYDLFRLQGIKKKWFRIIWDPVVMPRHSVCGAMAVQNYLPTIDRLCQRGMYLVNRCSLCCNAAEDMRHLFFDCSYSSTVMRDILTWNNIGRRVMSLKRELKWQLQFNKGKKWKQRWIRCSLLATVYALWHERNSRVFSDRTKTVQQLVYSIKYYVCVRLFSFVKGCTDEAIVHELVTS